MDGRMDADNTDPDESWGEDAHIPDDAAPEQDELTEEADDVTGVEEGGFDDIELAYREAMKSIDDADSGQDLQPREKTCLQGDSQKGCSSGNDDNRDPNQEVRKEDRTIKNPRRRSTDSGLRKSGRRSGCI